MKNLRQGLSLANIQVLCYLLLLLVLLQGSMIVFSAPSPAEDKKQPLVRTWCRLFLTVLVEKLTFPTYTVKHSLHCLLTEGCFLFSAGR